MVLEVMSLNTAGSGEARANKRVVHFSYRYIGL
jgi:hypothetical protein